MRQLQERVLVRSPRQAAKEVRHEDRDLSVAQLTTLTVIRNYPDLSLKDLAAATGVSSPSASAMVDKLVELGLVDRRPAAADRREIRITLTEAGEVAAGAFEGESLRTLIELLDRVGPETARKWTEVYTRVQECLDGDQSAELAAK